MVKKNTDRNQTIQNMNQFYCYLPAARKRSFQTENLCMLCSIWLKPASLFNLLCVFDLGKCDSQQNIATCDLVFMRLGWHGTATKNERKTTEKAWACFGKRTGYNDTVQGNTALKTSFVTKVHQIRSVPFAVRPVSENGLGTMTQFKAKHLNAFKVIDSFCIGANAGRTMWPA